MFSSRIIFILSDLAYPKKNKERPTIGGQRPFFLDATLNKFHFFFKDTPPPLLILVGNGGVKVCKLIGLKKYFI